MIRDIGGVETHFIYRESFNSPVYRGSCGGAVGALAPPKAPLRGVGGGLPYPVGASLRRLLFLERETKRIREDRRWILLARARYSVNFVGDNLIYILYENVFFIT